MVRVRLRTSSIVARGALIAALLLVLVYAPGGGASPADANAPIGCKFAGKRFVGTTSQRKRMCFTLTGDGRRLREYAYDYRNTCGSANVRTTFQGGLRLSANGSFNSSGASGYFKGRVTRRTAAGSTRSKQTTYILGQAETCDSGMVRWTARQTSG